MLVSDQATCIKQQKVSIRARASSKRPVSHETKHQPYAALRSTSHCSWPNETRKEKGKSLMKELKGEGMAASWTEWLVRDWPPRDEGMSSS